MDNYLFFFLFFFETLMGLSIKGICCLEPQSRDPATAPWDWEWNDRHTSARRTGLLLGRTADIPTLRGARLHEACNPSSISALLLLAWFPPLSDVEDARIHRAYPRYRGRSCRPRHPKPGWCRRYSKPCRYHLRIDPVQRNTQHPNNVPFRE